MWRPIVAAAVALCVALTAALVAVAVFEINLDDGRYESDADSIAIPIVATLSYTAHQAVFILLGFGLRLFGKWPTRVGTAILVYAAGAAVLYGGAWMTEWHELIAYSQWTLALAIGAGIFLGLHPLSSNYPPERTSGS